MSGISIDFRNLERGERMKKGSGMLLFWSALGWGLIMVTGLMGHFPPYVSTLATMILLGNILAALKDRP